MSITVANFKAEITFAQARDWLNKFKSLLLEQPLEPSQTLILCPPAVYLSEFKQALTGLTVGLGVQNLSEFDSGAYTGEITAPMLVNLADYVLIGHSERRVYFSETVDTIQKKINLANKYSLKVILCAEQQETYQGDLWALAYEPHLSIGTGEAADPNQSYQILENLQKTLVAKHYLYGGSVSETNANLFNKAGFNGVLVGKKSLDPSCLLAIVHNA